MVYANANASAPSPSLQFLAPTVSVTGTTGQKIHITSTRALGTTGAAANSLNLYICVQQMGTPALTQIGSGIFGITLPANMRIPFTLSAVYTITTSDTYVVGLCGTTSSLNWNNNEWGYTSAILSN